GACCTNPRERREFDRIGTIALGPVTPATVGAFKMIERTVVEVPTAGGGRSRRLLHALMVLFFLSGGNGLIYEVLWFRLLGLLFGVTIYAASTVFASFMSGLALGSFIAGRVVDRTRNPLLWYGIAEGLIGVSALATPAALAAIQWVYPRLATEAPNSLPFITGIRFLFSFLVLLVPTTLMGATLPIVIKSVLSNSGELGERASLLYASNTGGAIVGALTAGFYLIGTFGIMLSIELAATLNLFVSVAAIAVS